MRDQIEVSPSPADVPPDEVFAALGNQTRMEILWALWAARASETDKATKSLTFSELRERVGNIDSGQFTYHLNQLLDRFVQHSDDGYSLRAAGETIIRAVLKGTLTEDVVVDDAPTGADCPYCGADVLMKYRSDRLYFRCADCEGSYRLPGYPAGTLTANFIPPVVLLDRTPEEVFGHTMRWRASHHQLMMEGICPECAGTVTKTSEVCTDHDTAVGEVCDACQSVHPVRYLHACSICQLRSRMAAFIQMFSDPRVVAFYADHGYDPLGADYFEVWPSTVSDQEILSENPLEFRYRLAIDDDYLEVTLGDSGEVLVVSEEWAT